jgi:MFS family permease
MLHGLSSSILYTVGLAVLVDTVGKEEVGRWMGTAMSCNNVGIITSPLLGGIVYDKAGKMSVFGIMLGLGGIDIVLRVLMKERPRDKLAFAKSASSSESVADQPQETESLGVRVTVTEIKMEHLKPHIDVDGPSSDPQPNSTATTSTPKTSRLPGILALLRQPRLLAALYGILINETLIASLCATLPLFVHATFHWTALPAGLLFLCIAIPAFAGPLAGTLSDRFGARRVAATGFILTAPTVILLRLVKQDSLEHNVLLCALLTLSGTTLTLFLAPLGAECSFVAEETTKRLECNLFASSFSLMNCSLASAGLLGPLAAGGLVDAVGWKWMTVVLGCFCATGVVPVWLLTGNQRAVKTSENEASNSGVEAIISA